MPDSSWDNSGLPPQRPGMPTWAKALLGCGVTVLLLIGSCVGFLAWRVNRASAEGSAQWPAFVEAVKALQDPASTRALYDSNPRLKGRFPDAEAFETKIAEWRPALQVPPLEKPPLTSGRAIAFGGKRTVFRGGRMSGGAGIVTGYRMADGRMLVVLWEDGKMIDIQFNKKDE